jgi:hypothetical protein
MARQPKSRSNEEGDDILRQLQSSGGSAGGIGGQQFDASLLAMVVALVTWRGAAIQFGTTKDQAKWTMKIWYKGYPTSDYFETADEVNRALAGTLHIFAPKTADYDKWRTYADDFL